MFGKSKKHYKSPYTSFEFNIKPDIRNKSKENDEIFCKKSGKSNDDVKGIKIIGINVDKNYILNRKIQHINKKIYNLKK